MITINLLRISPDSQYLEFSVECPINYLFNKLFIKKYDAVPVSSTDNLWRDCSNLLQRTSTKEIMRISTTALSGLPLEPDQFGNSASTMYYVQFGAAIDITQANYKGQWVVGTTYNLSDIVLNNGSYYTCLVAGTIGNPVTDTAVWQLSIAQPDVTGVASDVNRVYLILKDKLLNLNVHCIDQDDYQDLIRDYMFLYAHTEAMKLERFSDAEMFYNIIKKSFVSCQYNRNDSGRYLDNCDCNR